MQKKKTESMTKDALINSMAELSGLTKTDTAKVLNAFIESVETALKKGQDVKLTGFGTFSVAQRAAREGRNPRTGQAIKIAASKAPKFQAGTVLKKAVA